MRAYAARVRLGFAAAPLAIAALGLLGLALTGCAAQQNPQVYRDNIRLENSNAQLRSQVQRQNTQIHDLQKQLAAKTPRMATLPPSRLAELFTLDHIAVGSATRLARFAPGHGMGFRVFVKTRMADGEPLPVGGSVVIQAFDLKAATGHRLLGHWKFGPTRVLASWYGMFGLNQFAFDCPFKALPTHHAITFYVTFTDALTGHIFTAQRAIRLSSLKPQ
ncbi:MAG: hypothetical protein HKL96_09030 [Phycisphaerales bacterium]|nr:hypothetical protein [Phycisphaerales bacterium]